jgi:hypothetical protein
LEGVHTSKALPEDVLKLADLFWTYTKKEEARKIYIFADNPLIILQCNQT